MLFILLYSYHEPKNMSFNVVTVHFPHLFFYKRLWLLYKYLNIREHNQSQDGLYLSLLCLYLYFYLSLLSLFVSIYLSSSFCLSLSLPLSFFLSLKFLNRRCWHAHRSRFRNPVQLFNLSEGVLHCDIRCESQRRRSLFGTKTRIPVSWLTYCGWV